MGFATDLAKLCERAGDKAKLVVRKVALDMGGQLIDRSPVDTGRFKNNWVTSMGSMSTATGGNADPSAGTARTLLKTQVDGWKPGQTIFITNSLPYAMRLEHGYSKQAPAGMVKLTVQNYAQAVAKAARELK
ncbi:HK97 gp10 family phage protein [Comamonas kerstersii]|uniref:HK97 gp10 family phage protein n=1 Tax=Comamonas kerstersii TaxID=225992 RepID=UPI003EDFECDB